MISTFICTHIISWLVGFLPVAPLLLMLLYLKRFSGSLANGKSVLAKQSNVVTLTTNYGEPSSCKQAGRSRMELLSRVQRQGSQSWLNELALHPKLQDHFLRLCQSLLQANSLLNPIDTLVPSNNDVDRSTSWASNHGKRRRLDSIFLGSVSVGLAWLSHESQQFCRLRRCENVCFHSWFTVRLFESRSRILLYQSFRLTPLDKLEKFWQKVSQLATQVLGL